MEIDAMVGTWDKEDTRLKQVKKKMYGLSTVGACNASVSVSMHSGRHTSNGSSTCNQYMHKGKLVIGIAVLTCSCASNCTDMLYFGHI